jgi:hypothetical protein
VLGYRLTVDGEAKPTAEIIIPESSLSDILDALLRLTIPPKQSPEERPPKETPEA